MKIEIGESLFYSWLRHVKECQVVQTNWKASSEWDLQYQDELQELFHFVDKYFFDKYEYKIFKQTSSLSQLLQQCECDVIGISIQKEKSLFFAVDVAFHGYGLNYGSKDETIMKVLAKSIKTAMCLYGYMECKNAEIVFASPKINPAILDNLLICVDEVNLLFSNLGFSFKIRIIANSDFNEVVLQPILLVSDNIADTSELFLRSYQLFSMFNIPSVSRVQKKSPTGNNVRISSPSYQNEGALKEIKIGKLANVVLRKLLEEGKATKDEIALLQQESYSKQYFDLQYPVLLKTNSLTKESRYYKDLLTIYGDTYRLCSEWYEVPSNNDRPYLVKWIEEHKRKTEP